MITLTTVLEYDGKPAGTIINTVCIITSRFISSSQLYSNTHQPAQCNPLSQQHNSVERTASSKKQEMYFCLLNFTYFNISYGFLSPENKSSAFEHL